MVPFSKFNISTSTYAGLGWKVRTVVEHDWVSPISPCRSLRLSCPWFSNIAGHGGANWWSSWDDQLIPCNPKFWPPQQGWPDFSHRISVQITWFQFRETWLTYIWKCSRWETSTFSPRFLEYDKIPPLPKNLALTKLGFLPREFRNSSSTKMS